MVLILICILAAALLLFFARSEWEKSHPVHTQITIAEETVPTELDGCRISYLSDLHGHVFSENNEPLIAMVKEAKPDEILVGGDMLLVKGRKVSSLSEAAEFLGKLTAIAPVRFSLGNHEVRLRETPEYEDAYARFAGLLAENGVDILDDKSIAPEKYRGMLRITGYTVPTECYPRRGNVPLTVKRMEKAVGKSTEEGYQVLLAHTPAFEKIYREWGADLTFSGHYHGGTIVLPGIGSLMSSDLELFPKIYRGDYVFGQRHLIVGGGLGTHSINIRFGDRPEVVTVTLRKSES